MEEFKTHEQIIEQWTESPKNRPLLMAEAMRRHHIWIQDLERPISSFWALIDSFVLFGKPVILTLVHGGYRWKNYGKTWIAFDEKPVEESP
ncbi:MAG: hypothetical protein E7L17_14705 [Clostridium sp.]|uniref:hypothetical protein n=1 Tax=Clostridium sp. TaxID=1506 RepID=UPI00291064B3|nr:hypothetical protein [Clostridium sp.]MDU7339351.1 hypothetical protein [Clostridium sp.]